MQGRGDSSCVAPGGRDVPFRGALGCNSLPRGCSLGSVGTQISPALIKMRSGEEKPQASLAAPGVCADPPGLRLRWFPARAVGESSALRCPHPLQDPDGSLPAQHILWFYNSEPSCASLHLLEPHLSSTGPRCILVAGMGTRSFSLYFPPRAAKRLFLLHGYTREDPRGGTTSKHTRTGQGSTASHSVPWRLLGFVSVFWSCGRRTSGHYSHLETLVVCKESVGMQPFTSDAVCIQSTAKNPTQPEAGAACGSFRCV